MLNCIPTIIIILQLCFDFMFSDDSGFLILTSVFI